MNDTPDAAETVSTPATATPMMGKAIARLRQIVTGNGLEPNAIALTRSDEATYTITAELRLTPEWEVRPQSGRAPRGSGITILKSKAELAGLSKASLPPMWLSEVQADVTPLPGAGWGLDGKNIILPQHTQIFGLEESCPSCNGKSTVDCEFCHGRKQVTCTTCHGAGHDLHDHNKPCPTCHGRNLIDCPHCKEGQMPCKTCGAKGKMTRYAERRLVIGTSFNWIGGADLPTELRRAVDRAGMHRLANGHADITQLDSEEKSPTVGTIGYKASLPFSPVTFTIAQKSYRALVLGKKGAILEMPPFLDPIVEQHLADGTPEKLRLFDDVQKLAAQRLKPEAIMRDYPVGLSQPVATQLYRRARHTLFTVTRMERWLTIGIGSLLAALFVWCYFTYWRAPLMHLYLPMVIWDVIAPVFIFAMVAHAAMLAECHKLKRLFSLQKARSQWFRLDLLPLAAVIAITYILYVLYGPNPPGWYTNYVLQKDIAAHSRNIDPPLGPDGR